MRLISADDLLRVAAGELPDRDSETAGYEAALDAALRDVENALSRSFAVAAWETLERPTTYARPVGSTAIRHAAWAEVWPVVEVATDGVALSRPEAVSPRPEDRRLLVLEADAEAWPEDGVEFFAGYRPTDSVLDVVEGDDDAAILAKLKALGSLDDLTVLPAAVPADVVDAVCELTHARLNERRAGVTGLAEKSERIDGNRENVVRAFATANPLERAVERLARYRSLL